MSHRTDPNRDPWSAAEAAAMVGADPARREVHTVEGPTLHDREIGFGRGIASSDRSPTCFGRSSRASARSFGPGRPSFRLAARALTIVALAIVAAGCGEPTDLLATESTPTPPAGDTTGLATQPAEPPPGANELQNANAKAGGAVTVSAITPKKFAAAHCSKPIMVVFYQPESILDAELYGQAKIAAADVEGVVTLAYTPADTKAYGDLPAKLGLLSTPGIATVGRDGTIENFWTSYIDHALIERSLKNAARSKPCKVTSEDAPANSALADATLVANGGTVANTTVDPLTGTSPGTPAVDAAGAVDPITGLPVSTGAPATGTDPAAASAAPVS